jgi:hypothetical protein
MPADPDPFPPPQKLSLKRAEFTSVNKASDPPALDAMEILRLNREREIAAGRDQIVIAPSKRSRRVREFLSLLVGGNLAALIAWWLNPGAIVFCVAGAIIFTSGLTWVMFFVMEDY